MQTSRSHSPDSQSWSALHALPFGKFPVRKGPQKPLSQNLVEQSISVLQGFGVQLTLTAQSEHGLLGSGQDGQGA